jgi:hypothetical protein
MVQQMKVLTYGEIMDAGVSVFHSVAKLDEQHLIVTFEGIIRVASAYRYLHTYLEELAKVLPRQSITRVTMDFVKMSFCNDNSFYVLMDIVDAVYNAVPGPVTVRRIASNDWQNVTLPYLLNLNEEHIAARTTFEDVAPS